jgi:hypothetical protein
MYSITMQQHRAVVPTRSANVRDVADLCVCGMADLAHAESMPPPHRAHDQILPSAVSAEGKELYAETRPAL